MDQIKTKRNGLFGTTPAPPLLEPSQTVSAPPKIGVELGGALSQNELRCEVGFVQLHNFTSDQTPRVKFKS